MREIRFRAWDKEEKFMLQDIQSMYDGSCNHKETEERYGWISCFDSFIDDDNYVVMQYTGLKDKNGTEIYEGDIVHYKSTIDQFGFLLTHEQTGVIGVNKGMTGFTGKNTQTYKDEVNTHDSKFLFLSPDIYEVIGNVWENPELLKEAQNESL